MAFDASKHLIRVQGGREYLPVAWRLVWFRSEHPDYGIATEPIVCDTEAGLFVWHARITDEAGRTVAEGTKLETARSFSDPLEKAETGAIGRALGVLGYGTQFAPEFDEEDHIADAPQPRKGGRPEKGNGAANIEPNFATCSEPGCGRPLTRGQQDYSSVRFGRPLCPAHQPREAGTP